MTFSERLDFPSILLFMGIGQMLLLIVFLFFKRTPKKEQGGFFLMLCLLVLSINLLEPVLIRTRYLYAVPHLLYVGPAFFLLLGPLAFWQFLALGKSDFKWKPIQLIHTIPFILSAIKVSPRLLQTASEKKEVIEQFYFSEFTEKVADVPVSVQALLTQLHPIIYLTIILILMIKAMRNENSRLTKAHLGYFTAFLITVVLYLFGNWGIPAFDFRLPAWEWPLMSVPLYLFVCYVGFLTLTGKLMPNSTRLSLRSVETTNRVHEVLLEYMREHTPYLSSSLSLNSLSHALSVPPYLLSRVINELEGKNFFEFVNGYRVEAAKGMITDVSMRQYTLEAIAGEAGFSNKMSFNRAFKKHCGLTPSQYRLKMKNS